MSMWASRCLGVIRRPIQRRQDSTGEWHAERRVLERSPPSTMRTPPRRLSPDQEMTRSRPDCKSVLTPQASDYEFGGSDFQRCDAQEDDPGTGWDLHLLAFLQCVETAVPSFHSLREADINGGWHGAK